MKRRLSVLLGGALVALAPHAGLAAALTPYLAPIVSEAGPHSERIDQVCTTTDDEGRSIFVTNTVFRVATGLHRWSEGPNGTGSWVPAEAVFEPTAEGYYIARKTQQQVILPPDLAKEPLDYLCADGVTRLVSMPLGVAYLDLSTGESVLVGQLKSCKAELLAPNLVAYRDCLDGCDGTLVYELGLALFEQSVVLTAQLPPPESFVMSDGQPMNSQTTRVLFLTEFFDPPTPAKQARILKAELDPGRRAKLVAPDLVEEELRFGETTFMVQGKAFVLGDEQGGILTAKSMSKLENRDILTEACDHTDLSRLLQTLPVKTAAADRKYRTAKLSPNGKSGILPTRAGTVRSARIDPRTRIREARFLPAPAVPGGSVGGPALAKLREQLGGPGVLVDYTTIGTDQSNYTFKGDTTYLITQAVNMSGVTTLEPGTVLRYTTNSGVQLNIVSGGSVVCAGTPYRAITLTARDDPSCGETITPTNSFTSTYATVALNFMGSNSANLQHLRIVRAQTAIAFAGGGTGHVVSHAQFVDCQNVLSTASGADVSLRNVLVTNAVNVVNASGTSTVRGEHWTVNVAGNLYTGSATVLLTNSLVVAVTGQTNFSGVGNVLLSSGTGVFQGCGAGWAYLAAGSPYRDYAGASTSLSVGLWNDLKKMTTWPPVQLVNDFTVNTTLFPQAQRDTDALDLGYHATPLDYVWTGLNLTNATLILTNGVAVAVIGAKGTTLKNGARFYSEGTPMNLNRLVRYSAVQEQPILLGATASSLIDVSGAPSPLPEVRLRFTDVSLLADSSTRRYLLANNGAVVSTLALTDCQLRGVYLNLFANYAGPMTVALTNNLIQRGNLTWYQENISGYYAFTLNLYNNLFRQGSVSFSYKHNGTTWTVKDNLFDPDTLSNSSTYSLAAGYNGYRNGLTSLGGSGNKTGLTMDYQSGPAANWFGVLGGFYYPASGTNLFALIDAGSRTREAAALFHYSVKPATGTKEGLDASATVDIGYHWVGVNANNEPSDVDGDGLIDVAEDKDNDSVVDPGETDWQVSENGTTGSPGLQVFTPLKN